MKYERYYNSPNMYFIILEEKRLPVFICGGKLCIPIFFDYNDAESFKTKYLSNNNSTIITVDISQGMKFIERLLKGNYYVPQIGIYEETLNCIDSKEFINYYKYKQNNNTILNEILDQKEKGYDFFKEKDTIITLLTNSPFYVLVNTAESNGHDYYKAIYNENHSLMGLLHVDNKNKPIDIYNIDSTIYLFTSEDSFETFKKSVPTTENKNIKEYLYLDDLIKDISTEKLDVDNIMINPAKSDIQLELDEILNYLPENNNMLN